MTAFDGAVMVAIALFGGSAFGQDPPDPPPFVGLPLEVLPSLGFAAPTLSRELAELRIPLPAGGVAVLEVAATEAEAEILFDRRLATGATSWPPVPSPLLFTRAAGDGRAILLVRERNAVLFVRDLGSDATSVATAILGALVSDPARCDGTGRSDPDGARWDGCGRRLSPGAP